MLKGCELMSPLTYCRWEYKENYLGGQLAESIWATNVHTFMPWQFQSSVPPIEKPLSIPEPVGDAL